MEPERPIENLLRDAAKKRGEEAGAPFELHPATRRLLQGEVARQYGKESRQPKSFAHPWARLWPKFAWGFAVVALAGVLAATLLPGRRGTKESTTLARNDRGMLARNEAAISAPPASAPAVVPTTVNAPASEVRLAYDKSAGSEALGLRDNRAQVEKNGALTLNDSEARGTSTFSLAAADTFREREAARQDAAGTLRETPSLSLQSAAQPPGALGGALADSKLSLDTSSRPAPQVAVAAGASRRIFVDEVSQPAKGEPAPLQLAAKSPPQPAVALPPVTATERDRLVAKVTEELKKSKQLGTVQQFTRVEAATRSGAGTAGIPSQAATVLASFQMEQVGQDLRIVDGDGSVYTGYLQSANAALRESTGTAGDPTAARALSQKRKTEEQRTGLAAGGSAPRSYFFRVSGTNRSVNQNVVFSGDLLTATNAAFLLQITNRVANADGTAKDQFLPGETAPFPALPLQDLRISGRASVGDRGEVQINAVPAPTR